MGFRDFYELRQGGHRPTESRSEDSPIVRCPLRPRRAGPWVGQGLSADSRASRLEDKTIGSSARREVRA